MPVVAKEPFDWTKTRVEMLRRLWSEGHSASQIALELGDLSRSAVIGKVHRLKLPARMRMAPKSNVPVKTKSGRNGRAGKDRGMHQRAAKARKAKPSRTAASAMTGLFVPGNGIPQDTCALSADRWAPLPGSHPVKLVDHKNGCRFPVNYPGETIARFCNNPVHAGGPYCRAHAPFSIRPR